MNLGAGVMTGRGALGPDRGEKRGTGLRHSAQLLIGDVLLRRGLRSPANLRGPVAVVCRRSTSWTDNAVPDLYRVAEATQGNSKGSSDSYEETFVLGIPCHSAVNDCRD